MKVSIIGLGFVGDAMLTSFSQKQSSLTDFPIILSYYDKFKNGGIGSIDDCITSDILFIALPTLFNTELCSYDYSPIIETCEILSTNKFNGIIVIKSTIEPGLTEKFSNDFPKLHFMHNPEFLSARTAFIDFHSPSHIVLGVSQNCPSDKADLVNLFYKTLYPKAVINKCSSKESECMKVFCNSFYSVKIQFFNELYLLCDKINVNYDNVLGLMLQNNWINPMHTEVPGSDGKLSYGGACFPKDTNALLEFMKINNTPHAILESCIKERNSMRDI
jgi:UDPglucose 6-dehydrogenase